jgi:hypothetical protein
VPVTISPSTNDMHLEFTLPEHEQDPLRRLERLYDSTGR